MCYAPGLSVTDRRGQRSKTILKAIGFPQTQLELELKMQLHTLAVYALTAVLLLQLPLAKATEPELKFPDEQIDLSGIRELLNSKTGSDVSEANSRLSPMKKLFRSLSGNPDTEIAINRTLRWLDNHQLADGGWSFDHVTGECQCGNAGSMTTVRNAATALALFPYLGSGQTPTAGDRMQQTRRRRQLSHS